jgi:hypothetical protein
MLKLFKSDFQKFALALTFGALSTGITSTATAASTYDAEAGLMVTLTNVTDLAGGAVSNDDWNVIIEGAFPSSTSMDSTGDGIANANATSNIDDFSFVFLEIGDFVSQTATSDGTATNGTATSDASVGVYFQGISNSSEQTLRFIFDYDFTAIVTVTGDDALASASVSLLGSDVDILAQANANSILGPLSDDQSTSGTIIFELGYGGYAQMIADLSSSGSATSVVPVPAAAWLFGSGLLGLVAVARRKKA